MAKEIENWDQDGAALESFEKVPMAANMNQVSKTTFSKRKLYSQEKPRKILRTGTNTSYERQNDTEHKQEDQVEQRFTDAFDFIASENVNTFTPLYRVDTSAPSGSSLKCLDKKANKSVSSVDDVEAVSCEPGVEISASNNQAKPTQSSPQHETGIKMEEVVAPEQTFTQHSDDEPTNEEPSLGPRAFGLIPVRNRPQSSSPASPSNGHTELEEKMSALQQQLTLLQQKHGILQQSHEKLAELVEAQNHLLACHTAPPPTREALASFPMDESEFVQSPEVATPLSEATGFARVREAVETEQQLKLPRRVTAKDIIQLWEEGSRYLPPVKNWTPAQKMKVQSKLSRWKKIIDIFKTDCRGEMETFESRYSSDGGELLPVTTILALHENQLSSEFLSKGFSNTKLNTIELRSPVECKKELLDDDAYEGSHEDAAMSDEGAAVVKDSGGDDEKTNRYVLPRKVTARDVVHMWDNGCDDFPAIGTWSKAQKIGQETKIFRWRKIVDIFKKDCDSDWDAFAERYSNDKGELLPLATILAKHDAMFAQDQLVTSKQSADSEANDAATKGAPKTPATTPRSVKSETSQDPDCVTLPRKVTAYEVVRYWTEGCETFGPVKDWSRTQKMGQETKISRWKKIYEIFRYQCYRDWDEFCRRYTNQRGELLPVATILAKYEAENPAGIPSYQLHAKESPGNLTPESFTGTDGSFDVSSRQGEVAEESWALPHPGNVVISVNENGEYVLPAKLSPVDALFLWEYGTEQAPPLKDWSDEQVQQPSRLACVRRLSDIMEADCGGQLRRFVERFSDTDGDLLPVAGIIYSSDCRKYSPYFTEFEKSIKQSRSRGEQYELPKRVSAKEIVWLWEHGCRDFPPVKAWSSAQKLRYTTKLSRWRKIVEIFHTKCDTNWRSYEEKYSNENGELVAISTVISMQDDTDSYASMIKKSINSPEASKAKPWPSSSETTPPSSKSAEKGDGDCYTNGDALGDASEASGDSSKDFQLPRKVNARDIINFWERGFGDMPPVAQWSPLQKFRQRSKISRWSKIYDIYKNHCKGDVVEFEKLYSDKEGQLLPATTIISMYESRVDGDSCSRSLVEEFAAPSGPVVRRYVLPRKVDAKDIVRLWDEGTEDFPPISSWLKADKIGQETKIFRWKKVVDIFKNHCSSDWAVFEELFSNEYGELLTTSAVIARYETTCTKD